MSRNPLTEPFKKEPFKGPLKPQKSPKGAPGLARLRVRSTELGDVGGLGGGHAFTGGVGRGGVWVFEFRGFRLTWGCIRGSTTHKPFLGPCGGSLKAPVIQEGLKGSGLTADVIQSFEFMRVLVGFGGWGYRQRMWISGRVMLCWRCDDSAHCRSHSR